MKKVWLGMGLLLFVVVCLALPGRRTNPPIEREIVWNSTSTKDQFYRSCADCHSHETIWPWYAKVAPFSWLVINHVNEGRAHFNISAADIGDADEAAETVEEGEMPPRTYVWLHREAAVNDPARFIAGLQATFGGEQEATRSSEYLGTDHGDPDHD